ncbi:TetR/AcrR family transcriptional regulator [Vibrio sp.]|nr:TetR/AcrR family transcriptional regulator [Vibrio sp.]
MPKRSKEETEITINTIMDAATDQLLRLGYDHMSYTTLSQQTGISRTGISYHFPKKEDFLLLLEGRLHSKLTAHLDYSGDVHRFKRSWLSSLNKPEFAAILKLIFHPVNTGKQADSFSKKCMNYVQSLFVTRFTEENLPQLEWLIGKSLISLYTREEILA